MLVGPTNNDKSFWLNLLELMFKCFVKPAKGTHGWVWTNVGLPTSIISGGQQN